MVQNSSKILCSRRRCATNIHFRPMKPYIFVIRRQLRIRSIKKRHRSKISYFHLEIHCGFEISQFSVNKKLSKLLIAFH